MADMWQKIRITDHTVMKINPLASRITIPGMDQNSAIELAALGNNLGNVEMHGYGYGGRVSPSAMLAASEATAHPQDAFGNAVPPPPRMRLQSRGSTRPGELTGINALISDWTVFICFV